MYTYVKESMWNMLSKFDKDKQVVTKACKLRLSIIASFGYEKSSRVTGGIPFELCCLLAYFACRVTHQYHDLHLNCS